MLKDNFRLLVFIDPKGLVFSHTLNVSEKLDLWKKMKEIECKNPEWNLRLDSWVIGTSTRENIPKYLRDDSKALEQRVVHQDNPRYVEQMIGEALRGSKD